MEETPAKQARQKAGLSLTEAAKRARVTESYLRAIERGRSGGLTCSFPLAQRLAKLYQVSASVFLMKSGKQTPTKQNELRDRQHQQENAPDQGKGRRNRTA